jgi:hypothetical protein
MTMNKLYCQFFIILALACGCAGASIKPRPAWSATVTVVDETSQPVADADVEISYYVEPPPGQTVAGGSTHGSTDKSGTFHASQPDTGSATLGFRITKPGYYPSSIGHELYEPGQLDEKRVNASRNPTFTVVLKSMGQPIPMYARYVEGGPPVFNKPAGYDLSAGDWVAPNGRGQTADIIFTGEIDKRAKNDLDYKLVVSFPNAGDGIQEFSAPSARFPGQTSALISPHEAPVSGYQPEWVQTESRKPGKPVETSRDGNRNYFLRVRTVLDEKGNVKSALYGKIYGDFMQFRYYLNPTPNSRNIEFDPKQNLLKGLKSTEQVDAP